MSAILDALPGTPMRVSEVIPSLARYWQETAQAGSSSRASQMNLVVVFGEGVTPESAREQMDHAFTLSRRYPCRIIALCPDATPGAKLSGKLHIACFVAPGGKEQRCGEALFLSFPPGVAPELLENQVSIWLESDLPAYVWLHGVSAVEAARYAPLTRTARRVVYDSSVCVGDSSKIVWPRPEAMRDLALARLLAVRQALGQFLSAYKPEILATGLQSVVVRHAASRAGEARNLMEWMRAGLTEGALRTGIPLTAEFRLEVRTDCDACLSTEWSYANGGSFRWDHAATGSGSKLEADIAGQKYSHTLRVPFLDQPESLAGALIF